jgi:hypothetical protein
MAPVVTVLGPDEAEQLARSLSEVLGVRIMSDWVEITEQRGAGDFRITVNERDVAGWVYEYKDPPGYASIKEPMQPFGRRMNGKLHPGILLTQHGQWIGMSTSGKSSEVQCAIAYITRCCDPSRPDTNAVVWVGGNQKLSDLVHSWAGPYYDAGIPCPIDWIANGTADTLDMMTAMMRVSRYRQALPPGDRGPWPTIILILDETSFLLEDHSAHVKFEGRTMFTDTMAADHTRGGTSADAFDMFATQTDINVGFGDKGNILQAQLKYTGGFMVNDRDAYGRMFGNWKLIIPEAPGVFWINDKIGAPPIRLKAPYIQTDDRTKPVLHSGLRVSDVSRMRQQLWTPAGPPQLDERSARAAGPIYANRRRLVDDEFMAYLTGERQSVSVRGTAEQPAALVASAEQEDDDERRDDGIPQCDRDLAAKLAQGRREFGIAIPEEFADDETLMALVAEADAEHLKSTAAPSEVASVTSLADRRDRTTWAERIEVVLRERPGQSLGRAEIDEAMQKHGWRVTDRQIITNTLGRMTTVARTGDGYRAL